MSGYLAVSIAMIKLRGVGHPKLVPRYCLWIWA